MVLFFVKNLNFFLSAAMEDLKLLEEWLANEKELRPLLDQMRPLLEKREELEGRDPRLALLRNEKEVLPREASSSSSISSFPAPPPEKSVMLLDNRSSIPGNPPRGLPTPKQLEKLAEKKKKANRKKHLREKEKLKEAKKMKQAENEKMDEELEDKGNENNQ